MTQIKIACVGTKIKQSNCVLCKNKCHKVKRSNVYGVWEVERGKKVGSYKSSELKVGHWVNSSSWSNRKIFLDYSGFRRYTTNGVSMYTVFYSATRDKSKLRTQEGGSPDINERMLNIETEYTES